MDKKASIERAIRKLANAMRIYGEESLRLESLFKVDREEAIDNIDNAFEMKLERFHTLYDVSKGHFQYFEHGETALLIALRNAIHHQSNPLFTSLNRRLYIEGGLERKNGASFLLARHQTTHGRQIPLRHYLRLDDLDSRLDPVLESQYFDNSLNKHKAKERFQTINSHLQLETIRERARKSGYPADQVYLDILPIFVSAACKVFKASEDAGLEFRGFDAQAYREPFLTELDVDLSIFEFKQFRIMREWSTKSPLHQ